MRAGPSGIARAAFICVLNAGTFVFDWLLFPTFTMFAPFSSRSMKSCPSGKSWFQSWNAICGSPFSVEIVSQ